MIGHWLYEQTEVGPTLALGERPLGPRCWSLLIFVGFFLWELIFVGLSLHEQVSLISKKKKMELVLVVGGGEWENCPI